MSARHQARNRIADRGRGRHCKPIEQRPEGRHRSVAGRPAPVRPILAAGGTVAAALTALVLSGAQGPLGALFPERNDEPRPTTASASPRGGAPTTTDLAQVASYSPAPGSRWGSSVWDVLFQQDLSGPRSAPRMPVDASADAVWGPSDGLGAGATPSVTSAGVPSAPTGTAPTAVSTSSTVGNPVPTGSSRDSGVAGPDGEAATQGPASGKPPSHDDEAPADPLLPPVPPSAPAPPPTTAAEPVIEAAEPVIEAVEPNPAPVTKILEPVVPAEPVETQVRQPAEDAARSVGQSVPTPVLDAEDLPAGTGEDLELPSVDLPG